MAEDEDIISIAKQLGHEWYELGVNLGYSTAQLENLEEIYRSEPVKRNIVMLFKWRSQVLKAGVNFKNLLTSKLEDTNLKRLAEECLEEAPSENGKTESLAIPEEKSKELEVAIGSIIFDKKEKSGSVFVGQKVKRIINCPVCNRIFHNPKNLACGHTFCYQCIVSLLDKNDKTCPSCRECLTIRSREDVDSLSTNTLIRDLIAMNKKYELWFLNSKSKYPCDMCDKEESLDFCVDCLKYMCSTCSDSHAKWPALQTHMTITVNSENEPIIELRKKLPQCNEHNKVIVSFCTTCHHGVCDECKETSHNDHGFDDLHSHCEEKRKEIKSIVTSTEELEKDCLDFLEKCDSKENEMYLERENALKEVDVIMNDVQELLRNKASTMRSDIDDKFKVKYQNLQSEKALIHDEKTKLSSRIEYLKFLQEYGSDAHIVTECDKNKSCCADSCVKPTLRNLDTLAIDFVRNPSLEGIILGLNLGLLDNYYIEDSYGCRQNDGETLESLTKDGACCLPESFDSRSLERVLSTENIERSRESPSLSNTCYQKETAPFDLRNDHQTSKHQMPLPPLPPPQAPPPLPPPRRPPSARSEKSESIGGSESSKSRQFLNEELKMGSSKPGSMQSFKMQQKEPWKIHKASPIKGRMIYDFKCIVSGLAVSEEDIAVISSESGCIKIFHHRKSTISMLSKECKKIVAPFDGVYSKDQENVTGLFFTETEREKKGVKILYKKKSQLKLRNFTDQVEDPKGISANDQNIFVCDHDRCRIIVFKKNGEHLLTISKMSSRFDRPLFVSVVGNDRIIISDPNTNSVRIISGIEDRCTEIEEFRSSQFNIERKMMPGKCCVDPSGAVLIADKENRKLLNCKRKQALNLGSLRSGEIPVAVSQLNANEIIVATKAGKLFTFDVQG